MRHSIVRASLALPLAALSLAGCEPDATPAVVSPTGPLFGYVAAPADAKCWSGTSTAFMPGSHDVAGSSRQIIRRWFVPESSAIYEDVAIPSDTGGSRFFSRYSLTGNMFKLEEMKSRYSGSGALTGDAGNWTGWNVIGVIPTGGRTEGQTNVTPDGGLTSTSKVYNAEGELLVESQANLALLSRAECEMALSKVMAP